MIPFYKDSHSITNSIRPDGVSIESDFREHEHGKPVKTIPLHDGYFEIHFPKALLEGNPRLITVSWIDFYR